MAHPQEPESKKGSQLHVNLNFMPGKINASANESGSMSDPINDTDSSSDVSIKIESFGCAKVMITV